MRKDTMKKIKREYNELIGGIYNLMQDEEKEYLNECKDFIMSDEKLKNEIYLSVTETEETKFDGKKMIFDFIQDLINEDDCIQDVREYLK